MQLTDRNLIPIILEDVSTGSLLTEHQDWDFDSYLYKLSEYEEAYESVELRQLDFTSKFSVRRDYKWDESRKEVITTGSTPE